MQARPSIVSVGGRANFSPFPTFMKILLGILAIVAVAGSIFADYKWRKWIADRRRDRE